MRAALQRDDAKQMQCVELLGIDIQDPAIERLSLSETSGPVMLAGHLDGARNAHCFVPTHVATAFSEGLGATREAR
jgi:hypothetical protein